MMGTFHGSLYVLITEKKSSQLQWSHSMGVATQKGSINRFSLNVSLEHHIC